MAVIINLLDIFLGHSIIGLDWIMLHLHVNNIATWNLHSGPEQLIFTEEKTIKGNIKIVKIHHLLSGYKCTSPAILYPMAGYLSDVLSNKKFISQELNFFPRVSSKTLLLLQIVQSFLTFKMTYLHVLFAKPSKWHTCM